MRYASQTGMEGQRPDVEALEARRLFAVNVIETNDTHLIFVEGTEGNDQISVKVYNGFLFDETGQRIGFVDPKIIINDNGVISEFPVRGQPRSEIRVYGNNGDDLLDVDVTDMGSGMAWLIEATGGNGIDTINVRNGDGSTLVVANGERGSDILTGESIQSASAHEQSLIILNGGLGADVLIDEGGYVETNGGLGNDTIVTE